MIADTFYFALAGLEIGYAACRVTILGGFATDLFGLRLRTWWPRSRNRRASIKRL